MFPVSLHVHERSASCDASDSAERMVAAYQRRGFGLVGLVGHNARPHVAERDPVIVGTEHGKGSGREGPHVVEYPSFNFRFLAHPNLTWPTETRQHALAFARAHGLDGVEQFSGGRKQYDEPMPSDILDLANDDAHNTLQIGTSFMVVNAVAPTARDIIRSIQLGNYECWNYAPSIPGTAWKGLTVVLNQC